MSSEFKLSNGETVIKFSKTKTMTEDPIVNKVINRFVTRSDQGMEKFGQSMADNTASARYWIDNAQEELMDGILYLEKLKETFNDG